VSPVVKVDVDAERHGRWRRRADAAGVPLEQWIVDACDAAAPSPRPGGRGGKVFKGPDPKPTPAKRRS
jgi:hypothetical protein